MSSVPVFRFLSMCLFSGTLAALMLATGASAQSIGQNIAIGPSYASNSQVNVVSSDIPGVGPSTDALNWAGYIATGGTYTSVTGSWVVPSVADASSDNVADATWVGIGGVQSQDLIQAGTEAIPDSDGTLSYQAWYETLPQDSTAVPLSISPGDSVSVSITELSAGQWEISFDDATAGKTYVKTVAYNSSLSSADWVEEMPVEVGGVIGLDDFGTINFESGYAIKNGQVVTIQSSGATPLTMDNTEGMAVATPSSLGENGSSFSVSRTEALSTPLVLAEQRISSASAGSYPSSDLSGAYSYGGYSVHTHRGRGFERITIQL